MVSVDTIARLVTMGVLFLFACDAAMKKRAIGVFWSLLLWLNVAAFVEVAKL